MTRFSHLIPRDVFELLLELEETVRAEPALGTVPSREYLEAVARTGAARDRLAERLLELGIRS